MIRTSQDIYNLVKKPQFQMPFYRDWKTIGTHNLYNNSGTRIDITITSNRLTIYAFHNMNSEYYETISAKSTNGRAVYKKFKELLFAKHLAAMVKDIEENYR